MPPKKQLIKSKVKGIDPKASIKEARERITELCVKQKYDPASELIAMTKNSKHSVLDDIKKIVEFLRNKKLDGLAKKLEDVLVTLMRMGIGADTRQLIAIHQGFMEFMVPKLRAMEVKGNVDHNININITKFADKPALEKPAIDVKEITDGSQEKESVQEESRTKQPETVGAQPASVGA